MPTLSVKLAEETRQRLSQLATNRGVSPHALMVEAIEAALTSAEDHDGFVADALRARQQTVESGKAIPGAAFSDYLKAKVRGHKATRPKAVSLASLATRR